MKTLLKQNIINLFGSSEVDASSTIIQENHPLMEEDYIFKIGRTKNISQIIRAYRQQPWLLKFPENNSLQNKKDKVLSWLENINVDGRNERRETANSQRKVQLALSHLF